MTQSKKATNTFISTITHTNVSLQSHTREEIFIWHERERKEANICRLQMEIKPLLVFILVPPSSCSCILSALSILLPHFRMGVHDWVNGLVSCKAKAQKTRSFLPGLAYPTLFFPTEMPLLAPELLVKNKKYMQPGLLSSEELSVKIFRNTKNWIEIGKTGHGKIQLKIKFGP